MRTGLGSHAGAASCLAKWGYQFFEPLAIRLKRGSSRENQSTYRLSNNQKLLIGMPNQASLTQGGSARGNCRINTVRSVSKAQKPVLN
jgi:hypothetical protein